MIGGLFVFVAVAIYAACGSPYAELHSSECSGNAVNFVNSFFNGEIVSGDLLGSEFAGTSSNGLIQVSSILTSPSDATIPFNNESIITSVSAPVLKFADNGSEVITTEFVSSSAIPISTLSSVVSFVGQESGPLGISDLGTPAFTPLFSASPVPSSEISFSGVFPSAVITGLSPKISTGMSIPLVSVPEIPLVEINPSGVVSSEISSKIDHSGNLPVISMSGIGSSEVSFSGINPSGVISGLPPSQISLPGITPDISSSEIYLPGVSFPGFSPSEISPPRIISPDVSFSGIHLTGVSVPEISAFEISPPEVRSPDISSASIFPPGVYTTVTSEISPSGVFSSDILSSAIRPPGVTSPGVTEVFLSEINPPVVSFPEISPEINPSGISSTVAFSSAVPGSCSPGLYPCGISGTSNLISSSGIFESVPSSDFFSFYSSPSIKSVVSSGTISSKPFELPVVPAVPSSESSPVVTSLPTAADSSCSSFQCENSVCDSSEDASSPASSTVVSAPIIEPTSIATPVTSVETGSSDPLDSEGSAVCENNICGC